MARYLLDTNHVSPLVTLGHSLRGRVLKHMADGDEFHVATVCVAEVIHGIGILPHAEANLAEWDRLKSGLTHLQLELAEAERAGCLRTRNQYKLVRQTLLTVQFFQLRVLTSLKFKNRENQIPSHNLKVVGSNPTSAIQQPLG